MKKMLLAAAAGMAAALGATGPLVVDPSPVTKPEKRQKRRAHAHYVGVGGSRSCYTPAGPHRNCGDRGISPKSVARHQARAE